MTTTYGELECAAERSEAARQERTKVEALHQQMTEQGVSSSVYGQAARETYIRQQMGQRSGGATATMERDASSRYGHASYRAMVGLGAQVGYASGGERTFTRAEVLAVLKAEKARHGEHSSESRMVAAVLGLLISSFERME